MSYNPDTTTGGYYCRKISNKIDQENRYEVANWLADYGCSDSDDGNEISGRGETMEHCNRGLAEAQARQKLSISDAVRERTDKIGVGSEESIAEVAKSTIEFSQRMLRC